MNVQGCGQQPRSTGLAAGTAQEQGEWGTATCWGSQDRARCSKGALLADNTHREKKQQQQPGHAEGEEGI